MPKHLHGWYLAASINERGDAWAYAYCDCGAELTDGEVMRCLNATEELEAKRARWIGARHLIEADKLAYESQGGEDGRALLAYASALEGW